MALRDFFKKGQQQSTEQSAPAKQETARDYYVRQDAQDRAALKPIESLPQKSDMQVSEVRARMDKATQYLSTDANAPAPSPQDGASSPEPLRQNMVSQDKAAPDLSPTSMQAGSTALEKDAQAVSSEPKVKEQPSPVPTPDPSPSRGRGGWER